jgi:hypothetical protein
MSLGAVSAAVATLEGATLVSANSAFGGHDVSVAW